MVEMAIGVYLFENLPFPIPKFQSLSGKIYGQHCYASCKNTHSTSSMLHARGCSDLLPLIIESLLQYIIDIIFYYYYFFNTERWCGRCAYCRINLPARSDLLSVKKHQKINQ